MAIPNLPRMEGCGCFPTPLHRLDRVSEELGCNIFIKRDDLTGLGFSGNKVRKLQYLVHDAKEKGCNTLLTFGGTQTNHGRQTAAVACRYGMKSIIIATSEDGKIPEHLSGNLLLDAILDCDVRFLDTSMLHSGDKHLNVDEIKAETMRLRQIAAEKVIAEYEARGDKVYMMPPGGSTTIGGMGYFYTAKEIMEQLEQMHQPIDYLICSSGSNGTYAGLWLGSKYFGASYQVIGAAVSPRSELYIENMVKYINEISSSYGLGITAAPEDMHLLCTEYAGTAYDVPDEKTFETIYRLARSEGIFVDPCYTGKGFSAVYGLVESGQIPKGSSVLFVHTGGLPGLFSQQHLDMFSRDLWENKPHEIMRF